MKPQRFMVVVGAVACLLLSGGRVNAGEYLVNGDFENFPITGDNTQEVPPGWTEQFPPVTSDAHGRSGGIAPGSTYAFYVMPSPTHGNGWLQTGMDTAGNSVLDIVFAAEDPTNGDVHFRLDRGAYNNPGFWRIRVEIKQATGDLRVENITLMSNAIAFSTDANADRDFDDAGDTSNVYRMRVVLHHDEASPSYDVYLSAANVLDGTFANQWLGRTTWMTSGNPPGWVPTNGPDTFIISDDANTNKLQIFDNVSLAAPEPPPPVPVGTVFEAK